MTDDEALKELRTPAGRKRLLAKAAAMVAHPSAGKTDVERSKALRQCVEAAHRMAEVEDAERLIKRAQQARAELTGNAPSKASPPATASGTGPARGVH